MTAFLDTSFLMRCFTGQPVHLAAIAREVVDGSEEFVVTPVILAEAGYTLTELVRVPRDEAVDQLMSFLRKQNVVVAGMDKALAAEALLLCRPSGRVSFADALLWADARVSGHAVYTFENRLPDEGIDVRRAAGA